MFARIRKLAGDRSGITMVEYGIMAALIAAVLIVAVPKLTTAVTNAFDTVSSDMTPASS